MFESILQDVRYGIRQLRQSPGFTLAAVLSLALGIGANTAIFELVNAIRLKMLPVRNPGELVAIDVRKGERIIVTGAQFGPVPGRRRQRPDDEKILRPPENRA